MEHNNNNNNNNNNYSYSSYPDSNASTPRSREVDCETDDQNNPNPNSNPNSINNNNNNVSNYKVKLMCSYGGKILPRPHDNQLTYIGGDTKILTVDRNIRYASILHKLNSISDFNCDVCFKYQLPGEDLDALISVTNDEDLEHMMTEYDRIFRSSVKPVRLRLFMFPLSPNAFSGGSDCKSEQQWFVDALNAVQISSAQGSSPASASENPDFLFGFDKGNVAVAVAAAAPVMTMAKVQDVAAVVVQTGNVDSARPESECGSEDSNSNRQVISDPVVSPMTLEIQRQMQESQRMQIAASHEQTIINDPRAYYGDYYAQKIQPHATGQPRYWQEQRTGTGGYSDSPVYLIPSSTGVYPSPSPPTVPAPPAAQTLRPPTQVSQGQAYYGMQGMQRMVNVNVNPPEFYREQQQPVYNTMTQPQIQQPKVGTYQEALGLVRPQTELTYGQVGQLGQVGIDATGRQVYYTTSQGGMTPTYQPLVAAVNQEGKMVVNPNKGL